ncbi:MAG: hypothetical protein AAB316_17070, partial [Bacteroidota bacterium]
IAALVGILFFTFLALGFAVGGLEYLEQKMKNPFTNWVNRDVDNAIVDSSAVVIERYSSPTVQDSFLLKSAEGFGRYVLDFYRHSFDPLRHPPDTLLLRCWGRTVKPDEVLLNSILSPSNVVWQVKDLDLASVNPCDILVTQAMLTLNGFEIPEDYEAEIYLPINDDGNLIFLRVFAVVKELPGLTNRFISFPKLHNVLKAAQVDGKKCKDLVTSNRNSGTNRLMLAAGSPPLDGIHALAKAFFNVNTGLFTDASEHVYKTPWWDYRGISLSFPAGKTPGKDSLSAFLQLARQQGIHLVEFGFLECGADQCEQLNSGDFQYLAFHFNRLDRIRPFRKDLLQRYGIEIDMSQIESKENFSLVSQLTSAISVILLIFGMLSIVSFVNNLVKNH